MTYPNDNFSLTGRPVTGLTSPVYTCTLDVGPTTRSRQHAVTSLGGTQTGVTSHTVSSPFTLTMKVPEKHKLLGTPNPSTGVISSVPKNTTSIIARKGVIPSIGQSPSIATARLDIDIPAGAETTDLVNVKAMLSALVGLLDTYINDLTGTLENGII